MQKIKSIVESLLYVAHKPLSAKALAKMLQQDETAVQTALTELATEYNDRGIVLLSAADQWQFSTNAKNSAEVKQYLNAELREKLTEASVETLAIVAYRQPISKSEIEAIRGVNCQYSLRHLLIRGLIQKIQNPNDARQMLYETTLEFLQQMGLKNVNELPDFETIVNRVKLPETGLEAEHAV